MEVTKTNLLPDFLIIGAGKSGTTSLDNYLKQHPEIYISPKKEPNFFGYEFTKVEDFNGDEQEIRHFNESVTNIDDYLQLFEGAETGQMKGETSNTYLYHDIAPERIKHYVPNAKLIAIFRQPAERLYSRYLHLAREDDTPSESFEDCFDTSSVWWKRNDLIQEGFYFRHLSRFYELFPAEQIKVILYDDFRQDPQQVLEDIYSFIGVSGGFTPDLSVELNKSGFVKNKFKDKIFGQKSVVKEAVKKVMPTQVFDKMKNSSWMQKKVNDMRNSNLHRPKLTPETKKRLNEEIYKGDILSLQQLIGRDLSHWL